MEDTARPLTFLTLAAGAFGMALLTYTGSVWAESPQDSGRAALAFACAIAGITFLVEALLLASVFIVGAMRPAPVHAGVATVLGAMAFLVGFVAASLLISESMVTWFDEIPIMPQGLIILIRIFLIAATAWLILSMLWSALRLFRRTS
ncbi:MAG: hypothetical protein AAGA69_06265 [Pseudomonadota bacterium]